MSFPRYPAYKPSGVEWLGEVPEHWEGLRLRFAAMLNPSKQEARSYADDDLVTFLPMEAISEDGGLSLEQEKEVSECLNGYTYFKEGDVCIAKITPCFENGKGAILRGLKGGIGFGTTELIVARPRTEIMTHQFLDYLFRSSTFRSLGEAAMYGAGGQKRVPDSFVRDFASFLPPIAEQSAIATFLDRETAKIDALIAEQQRLIELLQEKRQAVISHAVTKGLNPNAPMKDSGVEWLGEVPEHWEVCRVKAVSVFTTSGPRGWSERVGDMGALFVQSGDLTDVMGVDFANCKRVQVGDDAEAARTKLLDGDLVVCITGAKTGNVAVCESVPEASYVNQHLCLIRPGQRVHPRFLATHLKGGCGQTYFALAQYGLKQGLSLQDVREAPVALPPPDEQDRIIQLLKGVSSRYLPLEDQSQRTISLLQERRSALISAAVTGQIDVRELAEAKADEQ